ncbi:MAG: hypothetical protein COA77_02185 [Thaumarchaeota archaeon]|nr:MAG: hypothetical protein COA77_02185 [Nitrososphaerota archaeon]
MGKFKKVGIGIVGVLILLIAIGMAVPPSEKSTNIQNEETLVSQNTSNSFNEYLDVDIDELLPTIDELGLNWRLGDITDPNEKLLDMIIPKENETTLEIAQSMGLEESVSQKYSKLETPSSFKFGATVSLYKFDSYDNAFQQWVNIIEFQNENRAFDIYGESNNCRSIQEVRTFSDRHTDLCVKNNVLILVEYSTDVGIQFYDVQDDFVILPMVIKNLKN